MNRTMASMIIFIKKTENQRKIKIESFYTERERERERERDRERQRERMTK